jgi:hypothetical protein
MVKTDSEPFPRETVVEYLRTFYTDSDRSFCKALKEALLMDVEHSLTRLW